MREGMLWYDNSEKSVADKIENAATHFESKYGERPDTCYVNPSMLAYEAPAVDGIEIRTTNSILPNHFWLGFGNNKPLPVPVFA